MGCSDNLFQSTRKIPWLCGAVQTGFHLGIESGGGGGGGGGWGAQQKNGIHVSCSLLFQTTYFYTCILCKNVRGGGGGRREVHRIEEPEEAIVPPLPQ